MANAWIRPDTSGSAFGRTGPPAYHSANDRCRRYLVIGTRLCQGRISTQLRRCGRRRAMTGMGHIRPNTRATASGRCRSIIAHVEGRLRHEKRSSLKAAGDFPEKKTTNFPLGAARPRPIDCAVLNRASHQGGTRPSSGLLPVFLRPVAPSEPLMQTVSTGAPARDPSTAPF